MKKTIEIKKSSMFSQDYVALYKRKIIAEFSRSFWTQKAELICDGRTFTFKRSGTLKSIFQLCESESVVFEVVQPSALKTKLSFSYEDTDYELANQAWHSLNQVIRTRDKVIGSVKSRGIIASGAIVELSKDLPLAICVFLGWVTMVRWDDATHAAAAG